MLPVLRGGIVVLIGVVLELIVLYTMGPIVFTAMPAQVDTYVDQSTPFGANAMNVVVPMLILATASLPAVVTIGLGMWWIFYSMKEEIGDVMIVGAGRW